MPQLEVPCGTGSLNQEIIFEESRDRKVVSKVIFAKEDDIGLLVREINKLRKEVDILKKEKMERERKTSFVTNDSLINLWDNEYDDQWNKY